MVTVLTSHQCGPAGSNPGINAICGLSLFLALSFALRGFLEVLPHVCVYDEGTYTPSAPQKSTLPNSNSIWNA